MMYRGNTWNGEAIGWQTIIQFALWTNCPAENHKVGEDTKTKSIMSWNNCRKMKEANIDSSKRQVKGDVLCSSMGGGQGLSSMEVRERWICKKSS